jgi:hypothetical protein
LARKACIFAWLPAGSAGFQNGLVAALVAFSEIRRKASSVSFR